MKRAQGRVSAYVVTDFNKDWVTVFSDINSLVSSKTI